MKINQELRTAPDKRNAGPSPSGASRPFSELVHKQETKLHLHQLNGMLASVEEAGRRVAKSRNMRDLARYKSLVKRMMKEAVEYGLQLKQSSSFDFTGSSRNHTTVLEIDRQLIELTEALLQEEQSSIDILAKIGEIKGLLMNLYT
ncbi:YaaR family protein [Metabacillus indicus]|uniref:YaaR family protein n=1 Tax=Metabacillus indicus TaxID=246786 RepID=UPI00248F8019|nr:YaaR family protein [Metabacillus indicus]